jgi:hypothetical protein
MNEQEKRAVSQEERKERIRVRYKGIDVIRHEERQI